MTDKPNVKDYFIVGIATHDRRAVIDSINVLFGVALAMNRNIFFATATGTGISNSRQRVIELVRDKFGVDEAYIFWLDSDMILVEQPAQIAEWCIQAEKMGVSYTANCHALVSNRQQVFNIIVKMDGERITDEEIEAAKPFEIKVKQAGLAVAYIKTNLYHKFHEDNDHGEDRYYFEENPTDLRFVPLKNWHMKLVYL